MAPQGVQQLIIKTSDSHPSNKYLTAPSHAKMLSCNKIH